MTLKIDAAHSGVGRAEIGEWAEKVAAAHTALNNGSGAGSDFLGWLKLPLDYDREEYARIKLAADRIRSDSDILVVIGIGGSYLGARAVIECLGSQFFNETAKTKIYFAGNNISGDYLNRIVALCDGKDFSVNVISKSGTTTEPAVAFRVFKGLLEQRYGKREAAKRIYVTTDRARGTLKQLADAEGYETFVVPDDVGGRYSVLTAVGLLPIAAAGFDTDALISGAAQACRDFDNPDLSDNLCYEYAVLRNILYARKKAIELLVSYEPAFSMMSEWFKQLYGESEGKDEKGIFPASVIFSTDLHSMGQFIQNGTRNLFETVVWFDEPISDFTVPCEADNFDGLNFVAGKKMSYINKQAQLGTLLAHTDGGAPNIVITVGRQDEHDLGYLIYFFEKACAVSGYLLGVNPFNQPGVESYKKNMFALLGKDGYAELREQLLKKL